MDSIFAQTIQDWELIVCDSFSNDGTWEYLQQFKGDPRVRLHQVPKEGLYAGWNECLKRAVGKYVYIATADDTMEPDCLARLLSPFRTRQEVTLVVGRVDEIDQASQRIESAPKSICIFLREWLETGPFTLAPEALFLLLAAFGWGLGSVTGFMFKRSALDSAGLFPTDLGFLGDAEWTLRLALTGTSVWLPDTVATWRIHGEQASRRKRPLLEAKWFHDALARVIDDPTAPIPVQWRRIPDYRRSLLESRLLEMHHATLLHRCNLLSHARSWPRLMLETFRIQPRLLWERVACGFSSPVNAERKDGPTFFNHWLMIFQPEWPPAPFSLDSDFTSCNADQVN